MDTECKKIKLYNYIWFFFYDIAVYFYQVYSRTVSFFASW